MTLEEALNLIDFLLQPERLTAVEELVFRQCWEGHTYQEMAETAGYDADYMRVVGSRLWQTLSNACGERITKNNFRSVLRQYTWKLRPQSQDMVYPAVNDQTLELPRGQVPLNSPFYVDRPPIETLCYETIIQPGTLIRLKAPRQRGKTSLMARILDYSRHQGYQTVALSLQLADAEVFTNLTRFLQWFCVTVGRNLKLENRIDELWDDIFGCNYNSTDYFENYILQEIQTPLVLALDEVDVIFNHPEIASDFFGLLRAWYEKAKYGDAVSEIWQKLRLLVVHSTEVYIPLNIHQSPFNVGLSIELPEFTSEQIQDLATRYQIPPTILDEKQIQKIMALVGGNPYLIRMALYSLKREDLTVEQFLATASTEQGIYSEHLRRQLWYLQEYPKLTHLYRQVVFAHEPLELEPLQAFKLESMGLAKREQHQVIPSCHLYRQYFREQLTEP